MSPDRKSPSTDEQMDLRLRGAQAVTAAALVGKPHASDAARLTALTDLEYLKWIIDHDQRGLVARLRANGVTWQAIGDALEVTRSAAQQKFGD